MTDDLGELRAHLVDDGTLARDDALACENCGASASMRCSSCGEPVCASCMRYSREGAQYCPSCMAANTWRGARAMAGDAGELNWSYGGGVNSIALAVAVRRGLLPRPDRIVFADTGREGSPALHYLDGYVRPMLAEIGLEVEVAPHSLATVDVYSRKGELLIPAFTAGGGRMQTFCSTEWKSRVIHRYLRSQGVTRCTTWIGFSTEEAHRIKPSQVKWQTLVWPLAMDLGWNRATCHGMIADYGLPPAPKSACWMCPNHSNAEWRRVRETPEDWARAVAFDKAIRARDTRGGVFVHASGLPLDEANIDEDSSHPSLWDDCGNVCWT